MFDNFRRERRIRSVMRGLAAQRVVTILQPGNILVVEKAIDTNDRDVSAAIHTARMRGWVDVLQDAVPKAQLGPNGTMPERWEHVAPIYRLTEAGWNAIHRTQGWVVATFIVSLAALLAALAQIAK